MQIIFDYLSGKISGQEFILAARANDEIPAWFQSLLPEGADILDIPYIPYHIENGVEISQNTASSHPFWADVRNETCLNELHDRIDFHEYFHITKAFQTPGNRVNAYSFLLSLARKAYPELKESNRFSKEYGFYLDVCGECMDGPEIEQYVDSTIFEIYNSSLKMSDKKRIAKQKLREVFHITDKKYPRWIQGAEWPMGQNSPMQYIARKRDGERVIFTFQDVDTAETKDVVQFY